ncbi:MAG: septal ring lytic transglycosylase RlpA family protein [Rubrivivax sp.]
MNENTPKSTGVWRGWPADSSAIGVGVARVAALSLMLGACAAVDPTGGSPAPAPATAPKTPPPAPPALAPPAEAPLAAASAPESAPEPATADARAAPAPRASVESAPPRSDESAEQGIASWYGARFHGRTTASGETFDMNALTAAHRSLRMGTRVLVRSLASGRTVIVRINDRGPARRDRLIDLSRAAARRIGLSGIGRIEMRVLGADDDAAADARAPAGRARAD